MSNSLAQGIADFLSSIPPFRLLSERQLLALASRVKVLDVQQNEVIFEQGSLPDDHFYVIREGAINLLREEGKERLLADVNEKGDWIGLRSLLSDQPYGLTAVAEVNSLLYKIDFQYFKEIMATEASLSCFLAKSFASGIHFPYENTYRNAFYFHPDQKGKTYLSEINKLLSRRLPVTCTMHHTIQEAARIMQTQKVSSILIVDENNCPKGIITDKDLRNQIATGEHSIQENAQAIMSSPVLCVDKGLTIADLQLFMIRHQVHHLPVTEGGSNQRPLIGVITEHDLLVAQSNNPGAIVRKIKHSFYLEDLRDIRQKAGGLLSKYLDQEVSIRFVSNIMGQINDALIRRIIQLEIKQMEGSGYKRPQVPFCWLGLGSQGREEQLLRTDQDSALVFGTVPDDQLKSTREYFLSLAQKVTDHLSYCGFELCPSDMMASNPGWCLSLEEWQEQFKKWMRIPTEESVRLSTIVFDYRPIYGDFSLAHKLTHCIFGYIDLRTPFLFYLARDAVRYPAPLSFFGQFLIEKKPPHKDSFDIKARAMMPLANMARILILATKKEGPTNTAQRFRYLAELEPSNASLYLQGAEAYEVLMKFRARFGLQNKDSGRYINPAQLSKMDRRQLHNSCKAMSALQSLISVRYQLTYLL